MSDEVPSSYRKRITSLEDELGRDVCGYPDQEGTPCEQWPVDEEGRCKRHAGRSLQQAFGEQGERDETDLSQPPSIKQTPSESSPSSRSGWTKVLSESATYWIVLVLLGLMTGGVSGTMLFRGGEATPNQTSTEASLNVEDPDFTRIRERYRNGNLGEVESQLGRIYRNSPGSSDRAQALYYRYVLEQNRGNHRRAYDLAEEFLNQFKNHPLRPEVTFGAWFLADRFLDRQDLARKHREQLNSEYPDSKWAQKTDS